MNKPIKDPTMLGLAMFVLFLQVVLFVCSLLPSCHVPVLVALVGMFMSAVVFWVRFLNRTDDDPVYGKRKSRAGGRTEQLPSGSWADPPSVQPVWLRRLFALVCVCGFAGLAGSVYGLRNGVAETREGGYVAGNYKLGIPYREISKAEYWRLTAFEVRLVASTSIMICALPLVSGLWERYYRKAKKENG